MEKIYTFVSVIFGTILNILICFSGILIGGFCVDYILKEFDKDIHWAGDILLEIVTLGVSVPIAIVIWILKTFGVLN